MCSKIFFTALILIAITLINCSKYYYKHYGSREEEKQLINRFFVIADVNPMLNVGTSRKPVLDSLCSIMLYVGSYESKYDEAYEVFKKFKIDTLLIEIPAVNKKIKIKIKGIGLDKDGVYFNFGDNIIPDIADKIILKFTVVYDDKNGEGFKKEVIMELTKQTGYGRDWAPYMLD